MKEIQRGRRSRSLATRGRHLIKPHKEISQGSDTILSALQDKLRAGQDFHSPGEKESVKERERERWRETSLRLQLVINSDGNSGYLLLERFMGSLYAQLDTIRLG